MSPRSLGKYRCQPVGLKPGCMCARVSVFGVCLSAADLWGLLILTGEAASASLPAPPPASTWQTDRQADRQLSSQLVNLSPLTPTWDSQVCTWEVTNLPFLRTSAPWLGQHPCPPPPAVWVSVLFPQRQNPWGPFVIETWVRHCSHRALEASWGADGCWAAVCFAPQGHDEALGGRQERGSSIVPIV